VPLLALATAGIDRAAETQPAGSAHWAFQPLRHTAAPNGTEAAPGGGIDAFIVSRLQAAGLQLSPQADRRTLIRRLYFDVIGLPPSPEEVSQFVTNKDSRAYERLVDKLLASPHYGERWARHWLDVVRFAESHGFEMNQPRPNAWPYRDYVIRAFNEDKPYREFVREQIAGDALGADDATGFLVAGPWDQVKSPDPVLTANQRADELHDIVATTSSAFLGVTVGCARCHDHKFDPIPQVDYYAMTAIFQGVQHGERALRTADAAAREKDLAATRQRLGVVEQELERFEQLAYPTDFDTNALRPMVNARKNVERFGAIAARRVRFTVLKTTDAEPCIDELEVYAVGTTQNVAAASAGTKARASSVYPNSEIHRIEHINDSRHGNSRSWISNERGKGWIELEFPQEVTIDRIIWGRDREQKYSDRLATEYRIEAARGSNDWRLIASSADRRPYAAGAKLTAAPPLSGLSPADAAIARRLTAERAGLDARVRELARAPMIYGGTYTASPPVTHRLHRGDPMQTREAIEPAALRMISVKFPPRSFSQEQSAPGRKLTEDQRRRLAFADWLVDPANPLPARVIVNRLWQYHFGEGLVSTPSDFGINGARPTHPELLDWLAADFIDHGWSIKHVQRLILLSAAYRQSSDARANGMERDAGSRLLWRFPPRRLEAEPIRDGLLAVTGKLDLRMGGPGFSFFEPNDNYVRVYVPRRDWPAETFRRMIYGTIIRQRPDGVFGAFDCPDAGQIAPRRNRSTTPLQALNLLNSSFLVQQASFFAARLQRDAGDNTAAQVRRAFQLAFQRDPSPGELTAGEQLAADHGLAVFCRALLNANEFAYVY